MTTLPIASVVASPRLIGTYNASGTVGEPTGQCEGTDRRDHGTAPDVLVPVTLENCLEARDRALETAPVGVLLPDSLYHSHSQLLSYRFGVSIPL